MTNFTVTEHASESSGHFYDPVTRQQIAQVIGSKGALVRADIRHARKNGWYPGVTTIIKCAAAPGLEKWKIGQAIMSSLTLTRQENEPDEAWIERIIEDSAQTAAKAAEAGTAIHAAIQRRFEREDYEPDESMQPHVEGVQALLANLDPFGIWMPEQVCVHPSGYATKCDLFLASEEGFPCSGGWVLDFKSCDGDENVLQDKKTYESHWMQLAATRQALVHPHLDEAGADYVLPRCAIVYISRTHPGVCHAVEVNGSDLERGLCMFNALHTYWCEKSRHWPGTVA